MELKRHGANVVETISIDGTRILWSYNEPVAAFMSPGEFVRTSRFWSRTTVLQIEEWLRENRAQGTRTVSQETINQIAKGAR